MYVVMVDAHILKQAVVHLGQYICDIHALTVFSKLFRKRFNLAAYGVAVPAQRPPNARRMHPYAERACCRCDDTSS